MTLPSIILVLAAAFGVSTGYTRFPTGPITPSWTITTVAGTVGGGVGASTGDWGSALQATFKGGPSSVYQSLYRSPGSLFITDDTSVRMVYPNSTIVTVAGIPNNAGSSGDNGPASSATLNLPRAALEDYDGSIIIVDNNNHRLRYLNPQGIISAFAGSGATGTANGVGTLATFNFPAGGCIDRPGRAVYIAENSGHTVRKIDLGVQWRMVTLVAGTPGTFGSTPAGVGAATLTSGITFRNPKGVSMGASSNVFYVGDTTNNRVLQLSYTGNFGTSGCVAGCGAAACTGVCGDGGAATSAQLGAGMRNTVFRDGYLYIFDSSNSKVRAVDPGGKIATVAGTGAAGFVDRVPALSAGLNGSWGGSFSEDGATLFMADTGNGVVRALSAPSLGGGVSTVPFVPGNLLIARQGGGSGVPGYAPTPTSGDFAAYAFIDQYTPGGVLVSSLQIGPNTTVSGAGGIVTLTLCMGSDTTQTLLTPSGDGGALVTFTMYEGCGGQLTGPANPPTRLSAAVNLGVVIALNTTSGEWWVAARPGFSGLAGCGLRSVASDNTTGYFVATNSSAAALVYIPAVNDVTVAAPLTTLVSGVSSAPRHVQFFGVGALPAASLVLTSPAPGSPAAVVGPSSTSSYSVAPGQSASALFNGLPPATTSADPTQLLIINASSLMWGDRGAGLYWVVKVGAGWVGVPGFSPSAGAGTAIIGLARPTWPSAGTTVFITTVDSPGRLFSLSLVTGAFQLLGVGAAGTVFRGAAPVLPFGITQLPPLAAGASLPLANGAYGAPPGGCNVTLSVVGAGGGASGNPFPNNTGGNGAAFTVNFFAPSGSPFFVAWGAGGVSSAGAASGGSATGIGWGRWGGSGITPTSSIIAVAGGGGGAAKGFSGGNAPNNWMAFPNANGGNASAPGGNASAGLAAVAIGGGKGGTQAAGGAAGWFALPSCTVPGCRGKAMNTLGYSWSMAGGTAAVPGQGGLGGWDIQSNMAVLPGGGPGWATGGASNSATYSGGGGGGGLFGGGGGAFGNANYNTDKPLGGGGGGGSSYISPAATLVGDVAFVGGAVSSGVKGASGSVTLLACAPAPPASPSPSPTPAPLTPFACSVTTVAGSLGSGGYLDGVGGCAALNRPINMALSPLSSNTIAFTDQFNNMVRALDLSTNTVTTLAGNGTRSSVNNPANARVGATLSFPTGLVYNASGALIISDFGGAGPDGHRIRVLVGGGLFTLAGSGATPNVYINGPGSAATFNHPYGLALESGGSVVFCADSFNHALRTIDTTTGAVTTLAGQAGSAGVTPNATSGGWGDGVGSNARFNQPIGLAFSPSNGGILYVAEVTNHLIRTVLVATATVSTLAGTPGVAGRADGYGAGALFNTPRSITLSPGGYLVVPEFAPPFLIRGVNVVTGGVTTLAGGGGGGGGGGSSLLRDGWGGNTTFNGPNGALAISSTLTLIADTQNSVLRAMTCSLTLPPPTPRPYTLTINKFAVPGYAYPQIEFAAVGVYSGGGEGGAAGENRLLGGDCSSSGVHGGNLAFSGCLNAINGGSFFLSQDALPWVSYPVALDAPVGAVVITPRPTIASRISWATITLSSSATNATLWSFTLGNVSSDTPIVLPVPASAFGVLSSPPPCQSACTVSTLAGSGVNVFADGTGTLAGFVSPFGMTVGANGTVYVVDRAGNAARIRAITPTGTVTTIGGGGASGMVNGAATSATFNMANSITEGADGSLYIADANNWGVRRLAGGTMSSFVGCCGSLACKSAANGVGVAAGFLYPYGIAHFNNTLYISDGNNMMVRKATVPGTVVTLLASGLAPASPRGITVDTCGTPYLAHPSLHGVYAIRPDGSPLMVVGNGSAGGFTRSPVPAAGAAVLKSAWAVSAAPNGDVIIGDSANFAVRRYSPSTGLVTTLAGTGVAGYVDGLEGLASFVGGLNGVAVDSSSGVIYVADTLGFRVRRIVCPFAASLATPQVCPVAAGGGVSGSPSTSPTVTPTPTPSASLSGTATGSGSSTGTPTASGSSTGTPTASGSPTGSTTGTLTPSLSLSPTPTPSVSPTPTPSHSGTPPSTLTLTGSGTSTPSTTVTLGASGSGTPSGTPSESPTGTLSGTGSGSGSGTDTQSVTPSASSSPSPSMTGTTTPTPSVSGSGGGGVGAASTASPTPTDSVSPSGTPTLGSSGLSTPSPSETPTPTSVAITATPTPTPTPTCTLSSGVSPFATPSPTLSATLSDTPSGTPSPTLSASSSSTVSGSPTGSLTRGASPSNTATVSNSGSPTSSQTPSPCGLSSATPSATGSGSSSGTPSGTAGALTLSPTVSGSTTVTASPTASVSNGLSASNTGSNSLSGSSTGTQTPTDTSTTVPPTGTVTPSSTVSGSSTESSSPTPSLTVGASPSVSGSPSTTSSVSSTGTQTPTPTGTATSTGSETAAATPSSTVSGSSTLTSSPTASLTKGASPSITPSPSVSGSGSISSTPSPTPTASSTASPTATTTPTTSGSSTMSFSPTSSLSNGASPSNTPSSSQSPSASSSSTSSGTGTVTPTSSGSGTASETVTVSPTSSLSNGASPSATPTATSTLSLSATSPLSATGSVTPSPSPTPTQTLSPGASGSTTGTTLSAPGTPTQTPSGPLSVGDSPSSSPTTTTLSAPPSSSATPSLTPGVSPSTSSTSTLTVSPTASPTSSLSLGLSPSTSSSSYLSLSPTSTPTPSLSVGLSPSSTSTSTLSGSPTTSPTPSLTLGASPSSTSTSSLTGSPTQTSTALLSRGASPSTTSSSTWTGSPTTTPTPSLSEGSSPSTSSTATLSASPTGTPSPTLSVGATPSSSSTGSLSASPSGTPSPTLSTGASPSSTSTSTMSPSSTASSTPSLSLGSSPSTTPTLDLTPIGSYSTSQTQAAGSVGGGYSATNTSVTTTPSSTYSPSPASLALSAGGAAASASKGGILAGEGQSIFFMGTGGAVGLAVLAGGAWMLVKRLGGGGGGGGAGLPLSSRGGKKKEGGGKHKPNPPTGKPPKKAFQSFQTWAEEGEEGVFRNTNPLRGVSVVR